MYEPKLPLLLERDMLMFDAWDAMRTTITNDIVEHPEMVTFHRASAHGITLRIFGRIGISDLTGKPIVEDMKVMLGDSDIYDALPDSLLNEFQDAAIEEAA